MVDMIEQKLAEIGQRSDDQISLTETALLIAAMDQPGIHLDRYENHFVKIVQVVEEKISRLESLSDPQDELLRRVHILSRVIHNDFEYSGDEEGYDNLDNAHLIQVIERRRGIPVALGIIYIETARRLGWVMDGLNFPGHFLVRMEYQGQRQIIDPFYGGQTMDAARLRALIKSVLGLGAELNYDYYTPMTNRAILIRLCNNRKTRFIAGEDFENALKTVEIMLLFDPDNVRLRFDAGVLSARLDQKEQAVEYLKYYIDHIGDIRASSEASILLNSLIDTMQ